MKVKLGRCPFCGRNGFLIRSPERARREICGEFMVGCETADCKGSIYIGDWQSEKDAIVAWNTRAEVKG
jgi:Lar family restriction alleviation protein